MTVKKTYFILQAGSSDLIDLKEGSGAAQIRKCLASFLFLSFLEDSVCSPWQLSGYIFILHLRIKVNEAIELPSIGVLGFVSFRLLHVHRRFLRIECENRETK